MKNHDNRNFAIAVVVIVIVLALLFMSGKADAIGEPTSPISPTEVGICEGQIEEIKDFIYQSQMHLAYFSIFTLATNPDPSLQTERIKGFINWKRLISQENSFNCQEYLELVYAMEETMDLALYLTLIGSTKNLFDAKEQLALEQSYDELGNQLIYFMGIVVEKLNYFGIQASEEPVPNS